MKGLLGLLVFACLERRALAQSWNERRYPDCFVTQEPNLALAITDNRECLVNSTNIINLEAYTTAMGQYDWPLFCGIMQDSSCNIPFNYSCMASQIVKFECILKRITSCQQLDTQDPHSWAVLKLTVRCCSRNNQCHNHSKFHCIRVRPPNRPITGASSSPPDCKTLHGTPNNIHEIQSKQNQAPTRTPSETPRRIPSETPRRIPSGTPSRMPGRTERKGKGSSVSSTIVVIVFGCLIVLILAVLFTLLLIHTIRKRQHQRIVTGRRENHTTLQNMYTQRPPLPGEPSPYECHVLNESGAQKLPQQPSPYETATYSVLESPHELGGSATDEQHINEDADIYVSSPESGNVDADYEVSLKTTKGPNKSSQPRTDADDYANPDDALFDGDQTQPKNIKSVGGKSFGKEKDRAPISTQYQPSDDNDYSVPNDAIVKKEDTQPDNQGSDEDILNPLYHELGKNEKLPQTKDDDPKTEVATENAVTLESTVYEPAVSAPISSTPHPDLHTITPSVETGNTASDHQNSDPQKSRIPSLLTANRST